MLKFVLSILIAYLPAITSFWAMDAKGWYSELSKPLFSPPSWVFGVVWTILYLFIGLSLYMFWQADCEFCNKKIGFIIFAMQLFLNSCFTPIFFGYKSLLGGFVVCLLLAVFVILTMLEFYKIAPISAYLLIPYLLWGIFAIFLSYKIWALNS